MSALYHMKLLSELMTWVLWCEFDYIAEEVLKVLDEAWLSVSPYATPYFH